MNFIQREIDRLRLELLAGHDRAAEIYAAQQALEWALEPSGIKAPYALIMGTQVSSKDCSGHPRQQSS